MSERTASDRSDEFETGPRLYGAMRTAEGRTIMVVALLLTLLGIAVGGHLYGHYLSHHDVQERDSTIQQLQATGQKLNQEITSLNAKLTALQAKHTGLQAAFDAIVPSENTYSINPNHSLIVADGKLIIGLIGSPTNDGVNVNINGKQQLVVSGDVVKVALDPSTSCEVAIQSFDMFKAILTASCPAAKPK